MASVRISMSLLVRRYLARQHSVQGPFVPRTVIKPPQRLLSTATESLPRAAQPSIWQSIVPKALRTSRHSIENSKTLKKKDWNPATFFIVIFLLIGSNAIQMIILRNDFITFSRKAEAKIGLLKEVIERVHKGEDVDVEGLLGTGNEEQEREWEEVIREIEEADRLWEPHGRRRKDRRRTDYPLEESPEVTTGNQKDMDALATKTVADHATSRGDEQADNNTIAETGPRNRSRGFY